MGTAGERVVAVSGEDVIADVFLQVGGIILVPRIEIIAQFDVQ